VSRESLVGKLEIMNPYQKFDLSEEDVARLRKFRQSIGKKFKKKFYELPDNWRERNLYFLLRMHKDNFDLWYTPGLININEYSQQLVKIPMKFFDDWWDPDKWDWEKDSYLLAEYQGRNFDTWWDPDKYSYAYYPASRALAGYLNRHFDTWWDEDKFNYNALDNLAIYCWQHFDIWWNPSKITKKIYHSCCYALAQDRLADKFEIWWRKDLYNYKDDAERLLKSCSKYFHVWYKDEMFDEAWWRNNSVYMVEKHGDKFHLWWNKKKFNYGENKNKKIYKYDLGKFVYGCGRHALIEHLPDKFDVWWDKQRIRANEGNMERLVEFCQDHKVKWAQEFIIYELEKDLNK
jgi:hypothetical protein